VRLDQVGREPAHHSSLGAAPSRSFAVG